MFDYIIVGGGSAGCVVASRLSEDPAASVLLLEEGPSDRNIAIHLPVLVYKTATGNLLQRFEQDATPGHPEREQRVMVQARVLGGGSSVNAMLYVRGIPSDYDRWAENGALGWSYRDVLPFFKKAEHNDTISGEAHGIDGPLKVSSPEHISDLTKIWLKGAQEAGLKYITDFNSGNQEGCGYYQVTLRDGRRSSAAVCYLNPARKRKNLTIRTDSKVTRIIVEGGRATGVEIIHNGRVQKIYADREVVVSAGSINTPRLLLLSGIGPAEHLKSVGVPVVHHLPGVGRNLQDHMDVYLVYELNGRFGYDQYKKFHLKAWAGLQYALFRKGPVCSNVIEAGAFWHANSDDPNCDMQYAFLAGSGVEDGVAPVPSGHGCTLNACQTRPRSRGYIELRSSDPAVKPRIAPNYLSEQYDLDTMAEGVRFGQEIMSQPSLRKVLKREHLPGHPLNTKDDYRNYVLQQANGALHPVGTCRIGEDDMAVVDSQLRVHGIINLRIADASVMPSLPSGNTNAPAIMVGERAANFIASRRNSLGISAA